MATTSSECPKCLGIDWNCECHDGDPRKDERPVMEFVPAGPGECVGCGRKVKNRWKKKGKQAGACITCLWNALTGSTS